MLEKHKNVTHLGLKPHVCNLCHEGFGELNKLNRHKQLYHSKGRKISITILPFNFSKKIYEGKYLPNPAPADSNFCSLRILKLGTF